MIIRKIIIRIIAKCLINNNSNDNDKHNNDNNTAGIIV